METDISIEVNKVSIDEYLGIRKTLNWKELSRKQAERALDNSLYVVGAYDNSNGKKLIGMGRIVGDGAVICYVQDLMVVKEYRRNGVGSMILNALTDYVKSVGEGNTEMMFCLMCAKGREHFYEKHGFIARPTENLGPGMIQYIKI